ncbi:MAG: hypothetical protein JKY52_10245 [Flavobacteriales bacterium]|nr:hypothetical protein [Flavobacteriales bacterium]
MLVPRFPSVFRTTRHQRFEYKPIYYDEEKELQEQRKKQLNGERVVGAHRNLKFKPTGAASLRSSNIRIFIIVVLLSALAAYIITY